MRKVTSYSVRALAMSVLASLFVLDSAAQTTISLSGRWQFQKDPDGKFDATSSFSDVIDLPSSMLEAGKGDRLSVKTRWTGSLYDSSYFHNPYMERYRREENFKLPFFLTPNGHYVGDAWYRRTVFVPASRAKSTYLVHLERPHIISTLYINNKRVGECNSLSVPHEFDVTDFIQPGKENTICLQVNNQVEKVGVGQDSHSVTDQTQGNWNGVVGDMKLVILPQTHINNIEVFPNVETRNLMIVVESTGGGVLSASVDAFKTGNKKTTGRDTLNLALNKTYGLWDEFHPNLYKMVVEMKSGKQVDRRELTFGFRSIETKGKQILVNGRQTFLRGTVENCNFPLTGYPPTDKESWLVVMRKCKEYGLNHMRFHSYCPPEAAFEAADEVGIYLQPEGPSWPNHGVKLGNGQMIDDYLMLETQRMVRAYGNHPSFTMLCAGNEPAGNWVAWVSRFVDYWKKTDSRRIYTGASVGGGWAWQPRNQYHVKAGVRGLDDWRRSEPGSLTDFQSKIDTVSQPFVSHETGQWCVFPDLKETTQYTGIYKARNFEIFADILHDHGMASRAESFLRASGKLQVLCYKNEMERMLRTRDYAGYQLLGMNDYSGQGTALVGPLNVFWREKGYVDAAQWTEFCAPVTVLSRLPRFTYFSGDSIPYSIEVSNFAETPVTDAVLTVRFKDADGMILAENKVVNKTVGLGSCREMGSFVSCFIVDEAKQLTMEATLSGVANGRKVESTNHWNVWVYPRHDRNDDVYKTDAGKNFYICKDKPGEEASKVLRSGGTVLLLASGKVTYGLGIVQQFLPVFWNTSWFKMKPPHTTGMYVDNAHPLFRHFPTDDFSDIQWWALMNRQPVMLMDKFPLDFQPIVQPIDTWFLSRKLGMLFEANVEEGKLLMTSMPLWQGSKNPAVQQMEYAVMKYMQSPDFAPRHTIPFQTIVSLYEDKTPEVNMFTKDSPDELKKGVK